ncbi:MAG: hypothetical protein K2P81_05295 [Bacteriovoracaceae bacterium]|nr:hypothetical protein [Bacteriovoracaceae bacterium]
MKRLGLLALVASLNSMAAPLSEIPKKEDFTLMLSGPAITNMDMIAKKNLNQSTSRLGLWSGHYWAMYQGSLAVRYRDQGVIDLMSHSYKYEDYVKLRDQNISIPTHNLSPAEKYDLLLGDTAKTFTASQWKNGEDNRGITGVPTWRGICDGFSAASMTWPRPQNPVTLTGANGDSVTFYPEDIKALGSQLHAKGIKQVTFLGRRCDGFLGHITGACAQTNPGALHLALINRIGVEGKSFVVDASPGKEVWNYPVRAYDFTFTNPLTGVESKDWRVARLALVGNEDKLIKGHSRAEGTVYVVGVNAKVTLMDMRVPTNAAYDDYTLDKYSDKNWSYDLELDASGRVLGGEWVKKNGPDFIWSPREDSKPVSIAERNKKLKFDETKGITAEIQSAALISSAQGQPLAAIVEKLFELSSH